MLKSVLISSIGIIWGFLLDSCKAQYYYPNEAAAVPNFGRCITPSRERALCIVLQDCKYLFNIFISTPFRESDKLYLSRSQCGYRNGQVLICCPDRYRQATVSTFTRQSPPKENSLLPQPGQCGDVLSNKVYGGNVTKIDEFPWMALVEYTKSGGRKGHHCGGSLINSRYVLTASHCVNGKGLPRDWKLSAVRLGEWDTSTNPDCEIDVRGFKDCAPAHQDVPIELVIPHPDYNPLSKNQINDIALLRMSKNVEYSAFLRPICLPLNANLRSSTFDGIVMDVAGWGKTEHESVSSLKLKASLEIVNLDDCQKVYNSFGISLDSNQMCAGGQQGVDSCRGDSGGPLITLDTTNKNSYFLAGVVSFGPTPCALPGWPGVYTRVGGFIDWISNNIRP